MQAGEHWAFRRNRHSPWHEVEVRIPPGGKPPRVKIEFVADKFRGRKEWVSPARLEVLWDEREAFVAKEQRWKAFEAAPRATELEESAALIVMSATFTDDVAELSWTGYAGSTLIHDVDAVSAASGLTAAELAADPVTIVEDGVQWVPWSTTLALIMAVAPVNATRILQQVEEEERKIERESVTGYDFRWSPNEEWQHMSGEQVARGAEERRTPVFAQIRKWTGVKADERDELNESRREIARVGHIAQRAINKVRDLRSPKFADALEYELLNPPPPYPGYGDDSDRAPYKSAYHWVRREENDGRSSPA